MSRCFDEPQCSHTEDRTFARLETALMNQVAELLPAHWNSAQEEREKQSNQAERAASRGSLAGRIPESRSASARYPAA